MTVQLLDMLADPASGVAAATPEVTCPCGNSNPKRWTVEDCPITCAIDLGVVPMICDDCKQQRLYYETLEQPTWSKVFFLVMVYLAKNAARGRSPGELAAIMERMMPRETPDQRLDRLRDENLRKMFTGER